MASTQPTCSSGKSTLRSRSTESSLSLLFSLLLVCFCFGVLFVHILFFNVYIFYSSCPTSTDLCVEGTRGWLLRRNSPTHWPHAEEQQGARAKPAVSPFPSPPRVCPPLLFPGQTPRGNSPLMGQLMSSAVSPFTHNTVGQSLSNDGFCTFSFCLFICVMSLT